MIDAAAHVTASGKASLTEFEVLGSAAAADLTSWERGKAWASPVAGQVGACVVLCRPHTGRTHQIRVHLAHAGHPILGDEVYGLSGPGIARQALHAASLTVRHPVLCTDITICAPVPDDMRSLMRSCGLEVLL